MVEAKDADSVVVRVGGGIPIAAATGAGASASGTGDPALQWLMALGYSALEARQALASAAPSSDADLPTEERVRRAFGAHGHRAVGRTSPLDLLP